MIMIAPKNNCQSFSTCMKKISILSMKGFPRESKEQRVYPRSQGTNVKHIEVIKMNVIPNTPSQPDISRG